MTRRKLSHKQMREGYEAGLKSGRFEFRGRAGYVWCTFCGRRGGGGAPWMEDCILGHPYVCKCGRVFANRLSIAAHRRKAPGH